MKICMITALDPSRTGIPKYTLGIANGFGQSRLPIRLFLLVNKNAKEPERASYTAKIVRCWEPKISYPVVIMSCILRIRPDIVHVQHEFFLFGGPVEAAIFPLLLLMIRICGLPVVLTLHGIPLSEHVNSDFAKGFFMNRSTLSARFFLRPFIKAICRLSSSVIVHAEFAKDTLVKYYGVDNGRVSVFPHGVDDSATCRIAVKASENNPKQVLFFGFITPTKGIEDLIEAFTLIPDQDLRLDIVGGRHRRDDHYFSDVLNLAKGDSRISAIGYVPDLALSEYFRKCDFVVLPHRYQISSSGALATAFAYGKPVIVTNTRYFSEAVRDGYDGLVVPVGDVESLKRAIQLLAHDPITLRRLASGCRVTKRRLAWSKLSFRLWSIYRDVVKKESWSGPQIKQIGRSYGSIRRHGASYLTIRNYLRTLMGLLFHMRLRSIFTICKSLIFRDQLTTLEFRDGIRLTAHPTKDDFRSISESILAAEYGTPQAGDVVIDIGAYIGDFAVFAAWHGAKVWAYEPLPDSYNVARLNVSQNNLDSQIKLENLALKGNRNDRNDCVALHYNSRHMYLASSFNQPGFDKVVNVPYTTLEEVFGKNEISRCDLLKLDCEGCEHEILINCPDSILKKIQTIAIEYHSFRGHKLDEMVSHLTSRDFLVKTKPYPVSARNEGGMLYACKLRKHSVSR